jgi:penicillin-binding protein 2
VSPATPEPAPEPGTPQETADALAAFLAARDATGLYSLFDAASAAAISRADFEVIFQNFLTETTTRSLVAAVESADEQGAALALALSTAYFGDLEYAITALFTQSPEGEYRLVWRPAFLHPELDLGLSFDGVLLSPTRGTIFDRHGSPLAVTRDIRFIGLNRSIIADRTGVTAALEEFGFSRAAIDSAFASPLGLNQRVAVGTVSEEKALEANELARVTTGLILYFESQRVHPLGGAAAHAVGYTRELTAEELEARAGLGYRIGDRTGAAGLEASLEFVLAGQPGAELRLVDATSATVKLVFSREMVQGRDVTTTLDATVLQATQDRLGTRAGAAAVMDPRTNEVLALNSSPSFDPDAFERGDRAALDVILKAEGNPQANRATFGLYSAGSTFKLVTGAAGLASGYYDTSDLISCPSIWYGVDPPRRNWEGGQGSLTIAQGLMRSCNTVFYEIALTLYNETDGALSQMARSFGFGAPTGIAGLAEEGGIVPDAAWKVANRGESWYPGDEVNLGIGQGDLLITPLQLANAYTTLVNGTLRRPVILLGESPGEGTPLPLTADQAAHLKLGLQLVTGASGTASAAFALSGYTNFAGKSGTAEDVDAQQHVLFIAYAPASAPGALAAVVLDDGQSGSIEAGPMARDMILAALASPR